MKKVRVSITIMAFVALTALGWFGWGYLTDHPDHINLTLPSSKELQIEEKVNGFVSSEDVEEQAPEPAPVNRKYESDEFQAGMNLLVYGRPNLEEAREHFVHFRELGINSVTITFPFFQSDWQANEVRNDPEITPELPALKELIAFAHEQELSVMLRPTMDEVSLMETGHWRGQIQPTDPAAWFASYQTLLLQYAELAQEHDVEYFNIGTELNSMENRYSDEWVALVNAIRSQYEGELIYSFNFDTVENISSIEFVKLLDHVGIDAYYPLDAPNGASVEVLEAAWGEWVTEMSSQIDHPSVIMTEAGMIPIDGAYRTPYAWRIPDGTVDRQAQANYYEATFNALQPISKGIYWWGVTLDQVPDSGVIDYSPLNGPAEDVIRKLFLNPSEE